MTKLIGLSMLCAGLLATGSRNVSAQFPANSSLRALAGTARVEAAPQEAAAQPKQNWKSRDEYDAFAAFTKETDPSKQLALIEAFLQKFSNSDFKDRAEIVEMNDYAKLNEVNKAIAAARAALKADPDSNDVGYDLEAVSYLSFTFPYTYDPKASDAQDRLSAGLSDGQEGLALLQKFPKPANVTDEQFQAYVKPKRAIFNTAIGFANLQKKDYSAAITALKAAAQDDAGNNLIFSLMGQSYLYSSPPDFNSAVWYLARSVALAQAAKSTNVDQLQKFYDQVYTSRHGSDAGEKDIITQAATAVDPPSGFSVAPPPKHEPTGDPNQDGFYKIEDALVVGGDTAQQNWTQFKGQPLGLGGQVDSVEKGTDADTYVVNIDITPDSKNKDGVYDIQLQDSQADCNYLQKGDLVRFQGTLASYVVTPSFSLTLSDAKINADDLAAAKAKAKDKPKPHKPPVHHRPSKRG